MRGRVGEMTMRNLFKHFVEMPMHEGDPDLAKWRKVETLRIDPGQQWPACAANWDAIKAMNLAVNEMITYRDDPDDHWQTPAETLKLRTGDCEDYALLKFGTLLNVGVLNVMLVLAEIARMPQNQPHAFLIVELNGQRRVLDNKFNQLIEPDDYINLVPQKGFVQGPLGQALLFGKQIKLADFTA